mgnify:CR=1 FL=1
MVKTDQESNVQIHNEGDTNMTMAQNEEHLMMSVETDNLTTENITDISNIQGQDFEAKIDTNISINDTTQDSK